MGLIWFRKNAQHTYMHEQSEQQGLIASGGRLNAFHVYNFIQHFSFTPRVSSNFVLIFLSDLMLSSFIHLFVLLWGVHFILWANLLLLFHWNHFANQFYIFCVVYNDVASNCHTGKKASPVLLPLPAVESSTIEHKQERTFESIYSEMKSSTLWAVKLFSRT